MSKHVTLEPIAESYGPKGVGTFQADRDDIPNIGTAAAVRLRRGWGSWRGELPPGALGSASSGAPTASVSFHSARGSCSCKTASHAVSNFQPRCSGRVRPLDMNTVPAVEEQAIKEIDAVEQPARAPRLLCAPRRTHPRRLA